MIMIDIENFKKMQPDVDVQIQRSSPLIVMFQTSDML